MVAPHSRHERRYPGGPERCDGPRCPLPSSSTTDCRRDGDAGDDTEPRFDASLFSDSRSTWRREARQSQPRPRDVRRRSRRLGPQPVHARSVGGALVPVREFAIIVMVENPLLDAYCDVIENHSASIATGRDRLVSRYAFAIPTHAALSELCAVSPDGIIELGAGTGYWAMLLSRMGTDVLAVDADPAPSSTNPWFAGSEPWADVLKGTEDLVATCPQRTLLLVWPTRGAAWAAEGVLAYHQAGGRCVAYVGEPAGGRTGDEMLHKLLGTATECISCRYGVVDSPCTCDVPQCYEQRVSVKLPHWPGFDDDLSIHHRLATSRLDDAGGRVGRILTARSIKPRRSRRH